MLHKMPGDKRKEISPIMPFLLTVFLVYFLDRASKHLAVEFLTAAGSFPLIENFFHLTLVANTGGAFGIFRSIPWFFTLIAILAVIIICVVLVVRYKKLVLSEKYALVFILAGIMGNLTDRLLFGHVIDFIDFRVWPVFNIADCFITAGTVILIIRMISASHNCKGEISCPHQDEHGG